MILVDTGPLVAAASRSDTHNAACVAALQTASLPRLVPGLVIAEVCFLLARDGGAAVEAQFLRAFRTGFLKVADLTAEDLDRCADLVEQYADLPLGGTDASIIALAERLQIVEIATLDNRHFRVVRPRHTSAFTLLP
jgi:predicted nucleic acid-binding protein